MKTWLGRGVPRRGGLIALRGVLPSSLGVLLPPPALYPSTNIDRHTFLRTAVGKRRHSHRHTHTFAQITQTYTQASKRTFLRVEAGWWASFWSCYGEQTSSTQPRLVDRKCVSHAMNDRRVWGGGMSFGHVGRWSREDLMKRSKDENGWKICGFLLENVLFTLLVIKIIYKLMKITIFLIFTF